MFYHNQYKKRAARSSIIPLPKVVISFGFGVGYVLELQESPKVSTNHAKRDQWSTRSYAERCTEID